jgi:hypothetical protein
VGVPLLERTAVTGTLHMLRHNYATAAGHRTAIHFAVPLVCTLPL